MSSAIATSTWIKRPQQFTHRCEIAAACMIPLLQPWYAARCRTQTWPSHLCDRTPWSSSRSYPVLSAHQGCRFHFKMTSNLLQILPVFYFTEPRQTFMTDWYVLHSINQPGRSHKHPHLNVTRVLNSPYIEISPIGLVWSKCTYCLLAGSPSSDSRIRPRIFLQMWKSTLI